MTGKMLAAKNAKDAKIYL